MRSSCRIVVRSTIHTHTRERTRTRTHTHTHTHTHTRARARVHTFTHSHNYITPTKKKGNCALRLITPEGQVYTLAGSRHVSKSKNNYVGFGLRKIDKNPTITRTPQINGPDKNAIIGPVEEPPVLLGYYDGYGTYATFNSMEGVSFVLLC